MKKFYNLLFFVLFLVNSSFGQILSESFSSVTADQNINLIGWNNYAEEGTIVFQGKYDATEDNYYAQMSAIGSGEDSNFVWLVTPPLYLTPGNVLNFRSKSGNTDIDVFSLWISTNYEGNVESASWTELTFTKPTDDGATYGDWQNSGAINLDGYAGSNVNIAFKYMGNDTIATVWQIDDVIIINKPIVAVSPVFFAEKVIAGNSSTKSITISNIGGLVLSWDRDEKSFEKINYADWNLEENQLKFDEDVLITRKNSQGIFNIAQEGTYNSSVSPIGTEWSYGLTEDLAPEDYEVWVDAINWNPPGQVGENLSMHIIDKDTYFDIVFKSWTDNANGGGFSLDYKPVFPHWLSVSSENGDTESGQSTTINVTFDATNLVAGTYYSTISFFTNDPLNPSIFIPVELIVTGEPEINVTPTTYNYNDVFVNGSTSVDFEIENIGTDTLNISSISSSEGAFVPDLSSLIVLPGETAIVEVSFNPTAVQTYNGILSFLSNDADEDSIAVTLVGQGITGPVIELDSASFSVYVTGCNQTENRSLKITNTGGQPLNWEILTGLGYPRDKSVLVIQESDEWGVYMDNFISTNFGITPTVISSSQISSTDFKQFDLIITTGSQSSTYYSNISANVAKFEDFVDGGGVVQYQAATQGDNVSIVGGVSVINGNHENINTNLLPTHPITDGLPVNLEGNSANHCYFTNLPTDAVIITETQTSHVPTTVEYNYGEGKVIATGMTWGYLYSNSYNSGPMIYNATNYSLSLIGGFPTWLTASSLTGSVEAGNNVTVDFQFSSAELDEGVYTGSLKLKNNSIEDPNIEIPLTFTVNTVPIIELSTSTIDFKNIAVDAQGNRILNIMNSGCDTLIITNITSSLPEFGFDVIPPLSILPDDTIDIRLTFNPIAFETYNGILTITNNDTEKIVNLTGIGSEAPVIEVTPDTFSVTVNGCNVVQTYPVKISNKTGLSNLNYAIVEERDGSVVTLFEGSIVPGDSIVNNIELDATGLNSGLYSNELVINSNDTINPVITLPYALIVNGVPDINLSLSNLNFGSILVNDDSTKLFTVKNNGCDTLKITNITSSLPQFTVDTTNFAVLPGDSLNVIAKFSPTDVVTYNGVLTIVNNDAEQTINLTGIGIASAKAEVIPDTLELTIIGCDVIQNETITINNTGTANLNWEILTFQDGQIETTMDAGNGQDGNMFDIYAEKTVNIESFDFNATNTGAYTLELYYKVGSYVGSETSSGDWTFFGTVNVSALGEGYYTNVDFGKVLTIPQGETYGIYFTTLGEGLRYTNVANTYSDDNITVTTGVGKEYPFGGTFSPRTWNGRITYSIGVEWADFAPVSGSIDPGNSTNVDIEVNTVGLNEGIYHGTFQVNSNDPANPSINVPIYLEIQGVPQIKVSVDSINFGDVFKGDKKLQTISVINTGCDTLFVSDITNTILEFSVDNTLFEVLPKDTFDLQFTFAPSAIAAYTDTFTIINDDEEIKIPVKGNGTGAPEITISPLSFNVTANGCDVVQTLPLTIYNTNGLAELEYEIVEDLSYNETSSITYTATGQNTEHLFTGISNKIQEIELTVTLNGDYTSSSEYADLYVDGDFIGRINETTFPDGTDFIRSYTFNGTQLQGWISDGEIDVIVDNSDGVNTGYGLQLNKVQIVANYFNSWASGTIAAGGNTTENISLDATGLNTGIYMYEFMVYSNDPVNPTITVPYTLTVNGTPEISLSSSVIDFGEAYNGSTTSRTFTITNNGCDTLKITNIVCDITDYYPDITSLEILPGVSADIVITFAPSILGTITAELTISNNDEEQIVNLTGESITPGIPLIQLNMSQIDFGDIYLGQISDEQEYIVSGSGLTENISISAPYGFQISTSSGSGFTNSLSLLQVGGNVSATTIYVRFIPTAKRVYNELIVHISTGATQKSISITGEGIVLPEIITSKQRLVFEDVYNGFMSAEKSYTISADGLSDDIIVSAPTGFVISKSSGSGFNNILNFTPVNGMVSTSTIYVKFAPVSVLTYLANIDHSSTGATKKFVEVSGTSLENYLVTFNVGNGTSSIDGAVITIDGQNITTAGGGIASINLLVGNYNFEVTSTGYDNYSGSVNVVNQNVNQNVVLALTTYAVQFNVNSGVNQIVGATIALTGYGTQYTNASGLATFTDVAPATGIAYTVVVAGYNNATGTVTVVNANVSENVSMSLNTSVDGEIDLQNKVEAFPNPFTNSITIKSTIGVNQVVITNMVGQKVMEIYLNGSESKTIQTTNLANGIYLVKFSTSDNKVIIQKMVKE